MNDLIKLISKSLKPFGYHVRPYKSPNVLRVFAQENLENRENIRNLRIAQEKPYWPQNSDLTHMIVYVRTCIRHNRNVDTTKRITGVTLEENTVRCLRSLVKAVNHDLNHNPARTAEVIALDDHSDPDFILSIEAVLSGLNCEWHMRQTAVTGQGPSLHEQFSDAKGKNTLVYFCEDDYLHEIDAITTCRDFYEDTAKWLDSHCVLYPQEHAVLYDNLYPSYLLAGRDRHWRTMRHATHTFITHGFVVRDFWDCFENTKFVGVKKKRKMGSEARTTNRLFERLPGFSPLRPAAVHLQFENTLPPLYNWRPLWQDNAA